MDQYYLLNILSAYVLSKKNLSLEEKKKWMEANLVGEMTVINLKRDRGNQLTKAISTESLNNLSMEDDDELDLIQAISKQLHITTSKEIEGKTAKTVTT